MAKSAADHEAPIFAPLMEEYRALRQEIAGLNKEQYHIALAFSVGAAGILGAGLYHRQPGMILFSQFLLIGHAIICLELENRIYGLGNRLKAVEAYFRIISGCESMTNWESEYVPLIFGKIGTGSHHAGEQGTGTAGDRQDQASDQAKHPLFGRVMQRSLRFAQTILKKIVHGPLLLTVVTIYLASIIASWWTPVNVYGWLAWAGSALFLLPLLILPFYGHINRVRKKLDAKEKQDISRFREQYFKSE